MPTPLPLVQPIESVTQTGAGQGSSYYLYDAQNRLSRQIEGAGSTPEHLIYLEGYEDRVGGYRTRSYVDDYAHVTRYRYGQLELRFVLTDRLGSVVGVVRADRENTSSPLTVESTLAYDVFGTPRRADSWAPLGDTESWPQATPPGQSIPTTRHGFTGHEMLSKQRLIHMRGRLFDPRMGRFTGVDPVIQFPLNTQGLNPCSYLLNNPLAGTDPTGYVADWESVQERMWAMAGGYGANGSSTSAVLNGLRSAAAAVGMSGAAGDAKAANGAQTGHSPKSEKRPEAPSETQSNDSRPSMQSVGPIPMEVRMDPANMRMCMRAGMMCKETQYLHDPSEPGFFAKVGGDVIASFGAPAEDGLRYNAWTGQHVSNPVDVRQNVVIGVLTLFLPKFIPKVGFADDVVRGGEVATGIGAESANASKALASKLSALEDAQATAARVRTLPDGRIRYYEAERAARTAGPSRGSSYVTE